jgi:hypothetical protein
MIDYKWMSQGGLLLDGTGDISFSDVENSIKEMVRTRLKADIDGWKLYAIGAGLDARRGDAITPELEVAISRQVTNSLSNQFLPSGSFNVKVIASVNRIDIFVYLNDTLIVTASVPKPLGDVDIKVIR